MRAYWFSKEDGTTQHLDRPVAIGKTDTFEGEPIPCERGLHGSPTPWDALGYSCGPIIWVVKLGGEIVEHGDPIDKYAAQSREYLFKLDITKQLRMFAAQCALGVFDKWEPPEVVREYIEDEAKGVDRSDISAAASAASWAASSAASWAAASAAARAAQRENFNRIIADALLVAGLDGGET